MKKQFSLVLLNKKKPSDLKKNKALMENMESSLFLALFEKNKLTEWQYEQCIDRLNEKSLR